MDYKDFDAPVYRANSDKTQFKAVRVKHADILEGGDILITPYGGYKSFMFTPTFSAPIEKRSYIGITQDGVIMPFRKDFDNDVNGFASLVPKEELNIPVANKALSVGDKVCKPKGYPFDGTIVAAFDTLVGERRFVVDNGYGMLHIFNENNLPKV